MSTQHSYLKDKEVPDPLVCSKCKSNNVVQPKQRNVGKETDQCPQCGIIWCLAANCPYESNKQNVKQHQATFHVEEFLDKCSKCKGPKTRTAGNARGRCTGCSAYWCLVEGCSFDTTDVKQIKSHQGKFHHETLTESDHGDLTTCKCGTAKTGNGNYGECPTCEKFWCLVDRCGFTCVSERGVKQHYNNLHG